MGRDHRRSKRAYFMGYFNPLSPHGERPLLPAASSAATTISIHSPRMGRDHARLGAGGGKHPISIHSPRMGRDGTRIHGSGSSNLFQSTLPAWGETDLDKVPRLEQVISIHSPRMGRDGRRRPLPPRPRISIHSPRMGRDIDAHKRLLNGQ